MGSEFRIIIGRLYFLSLIDSFLVDKRYLIYAININDNLVCFKLMIKHLKMAKGFGSLKIYFVIIFYYLDVVLFS